MTTITLSSVSKRWKYNTTRDDPLFYPILGCMIEEEIELPNELVIDGALGESLDREWKYIVLLMQNMKDSVFSSAVNLYDILVLSRVLNLPNGWQIYVVVDQRISFIDRLYHMQASYELLRNQTEFKFLDYFSADAISIAWVLRYPGSMTHYTYYLHFCIIYGYLPISSYIFQIFLLI